MTIVLDIRRHCDIVLAGEEGTEESHFFVSLLVECVCVRTLTIIF